MESMIRPARPQDAPAIASIYDDYARRTAWTFALRGPDASAYEQEILRGYYPCLVLEEEGCVAGFAFAGEFRHHDAYRWNVELTAYLLPSMTGRGLGAKLMRSLLSILRTQGFLTAYSCITSSNAPSLALHRRLGFETLGEFPMTGYKTGQWHSVTWMQYTLGEFTSPPPEPTAFAALSPKAVADILREDEHQ